MSVTIDQARVFQKTIFTWWEGHKRDLPWRHTRDPYNILVSEMMLQQTQVARGVSKYLEFTKKFPTVSHLAAASPADVLRVWKGMGYNRRALYLQTSAKMIVNQWKGNVPDDEMELMKLPGVGKYTARAILVFAFMKDIAMVDTNIRQIITHFFFHDILQLEKIIQETADMLVPIGMSWEWHQALMDYGALELVRNKKSNKKKKSKPFKETNRYFRGRLLDLLREKNFRRDELLKMMIKRYGKDNKFYLDILKGLKSDGLISSSKAGIISLPE